MPQRSELVEALRCKLQEATECADPDVLRAVTADVEWQLASLPVPLLPGGTSFRGAEVDAKAKALYPEDAPPGMVPLACGGEGNHLFEAASVLLLGDAGLSMELQLRTMVEMLLHKQYYLKGMIDSKIMLQAARYSLCTEESARKMNLPMAILEAIFDADVKATCYAGAFTNMWHVYALASVLQSNIYSIYPMSNLKIRPYFNRLIGPRSRAVGGGTPTLHIMWAGERLSQADFKPQYFAPVVSLGCAGESGSALPLKTLELLNAEPDISYSVLRERYSITKSTFYRWKRQSREHRQKVAARYEARHYLQECFTGGSFLPLQQFRARFPDISRSTYYAWKHEMVLAAEGRSGREPQPGAKPAQDGWCAKEPEDPSREAGQRSPSMHLARNFLRECVLLDVCPPYKNFRKSYPWISRSTYYNWRREAINRAGIQGRERDHRPGNEAQASAPHHTLLDLAGQPTLGAREGSRLRVHDGALRGKVGTPSNSSSPLHRARHGREEARRRAQRWQMPMSAFRVRFPSVSTSTFLRWRGLATRARPRGGGRGEAGQWADKEGPGPRVATVAPELPPRLLPLTVPDGTPSKTKAKLFLQRRYVSQSFPSYREFSSYFPLTPRSTYYMWKRALNNGMMLMDC